MIKIPEIKYKKLDEVHFNNVKSYLINSIQFYVNCCNIVNESLAKERYKTKISGQNGDANTLAGLISIISYKPFPKEGNREVYIIDVLDNHIKPEFISRVGDYKKLFQDMLDPNKPIYIKRIITAKPEDLVEIYVELESNYNMVGVGGNIIQTNAVQNGLLHDIISKIFNYSKLVGGTYKNKWGAYELCKKLDVRVCPYCNRIYTTTVVKSEKGDVTVRPELDHFMPQSKFPFFGISFYNLIPSCHWCNSTIKNQEYLKVGEYLHPYIDQFHHNLKFDYNPLDIDCFSGDKNEVVVTLIKDHTDCKTSNSITKFGIEEIYKSHNDVVAELILKRKQYPKSAIKEIASLFQSNEDDIFESIFNEPKGDEIIDISLGKLRKDIITKLKSQG